MSETPDNTPDEAPPELEAAVGAVSAGDVTISGIHRAGRRSQRRHRLTYQQYRRRRRVVWAIVGLALVIVGAGAWVGWQAYQAQAELKAAAPIVAGLQQQLKDGDADGAAQSLAAMQQHSGAAHTATHDFLWSLAARLPVVGPNLDAVQIIADAVDELSWQTLPPLVGAASALDATSIAPVGGRISVDAIADVAPKVIAAANAIDRLQSAVDAIDRSAVVDAVADAADDLVGKLEAVKPLTATAVKAALVLPPMLGADGPRTYLVAFQNLAELRATGGIFGAYAVVHIENGVVSLVDQGDSANDIGIFDRPVVQLTNEEQDLHWGLPAIYPQDVNMIADFPRAAELFRAMYLGRFGGDIDGVLATDPVALASVLNATGPVDLADAAGMPDSAQLPIGDALTADNAVEFLLAGAYVGTSSAESNDVFEIAAKTVFEALADGQGDARAGLKALQDIAANGRLLMWSAHEAEQDELANTVLEGRLPGPEAESLRPTVGVFYNDGTGGKMDYYLRSSIDLQPAGCRPDGRTALDLTVSLTSTAPTSGLPEYVRGMATAGDYVIRTNVMIYAPIGGHVEGLLRNGADANMPTGTERGRFVGWVTVEVAPGETGTVTAQIITAPTPDGGWDGLGLRTTPMVVDSDNTIGLAPSC